jgi:hypothetical protein
VPLPGGHPVAEQLARAAQVDEDDVVLAQDVAVPALEGRAGDDAGHAGQGVLDDPRRHRVEPGCPVVVVEGRPGRHLRDVLVGVQVVALGEVPAEPLGEQGGEGRLARPRDPMTTSTGSAAYGPEEARVAFSTTAIRRTRSRA